MRKSVGLGLAIAVLLCIAGWTSDDQRNRPDRSAWEYKSVYSLHTGFRGDDTFNEFGSQGWELVAATGSSDTAGVTYTFKRRK